MKKIILSLVMIFGAGLLAIKATQAYFSSQATIVGNTLSAGTLVLNPDPNTPGNALPFSITNMKPGDGIANENPFYYRVNLRNDGTLNLKYRVRVVINDEQKNDLYNSLRIKLGEYNSTANKVLGTNLTLADLEVGILVDASVIPTALDTRVRTVWFRFYLPTSVGNEIQGQSLSFDIHFEATQTDNPLW